MQNELDAAMAEFLAKQGATVCAPILDAKASKLAAKESYQNRVAKEQYENAAHNAENRRYDSEGIYYIGGKR